MIPKKLPGYAQYMARVLRETVPEIEIITFIQG